MAFILLLNERQYAALKTQNEYLDRRVAENTAELTNKNQLLELENIQRVCIEADLRAQEDIFFSLSENIPDNILRHDLSSRVIYANQQMGKTLGMPSSEISGQLLSELLPVTQYPTFEIYYKSLAQVISHKLPCEIEVLVPKQDSHAQIHSVKIIPEFDIQGNLKSVLTLGRDITQLKKNEQIIREREREFRTLADNFPYILVRYDTSFRRIYVNRLYAEVLDLEIDQILNKSIDEVWSMNKRISAADFKRYLERVIQFKQPENFFIKWQVGDGELLFQEMYLVPEFDDVGNVVSILGIGHETNMFKKVIMELGELNTQLQELTARREAGREEERKHIAQEIHDDLGQLINVLRLHASMIEYEYGGSNLDLCAKAKKMVEVADQAIESVRNLITQLRPVVFDHGIIYALECLAADFYSNTEIACNLEMSQVETLQQQVPEIESLRALVIFRMVQEALTNVMRHSQASKVLINLFFEPQHLLLKIRDNGLGFNTEAALRENAFGLIGMRERMQVLQGELEIISGPGKGTEIRMRIPINATKRL
ncbi:hypothetical protein ZMTM_24500 [Methyloradius palustris]|uniref:PAS domain S-box protein n=1 Tax=Methyloradius palustris TaxID=2778876 RepID=A0A8D5GDA7_9PROT|nr:hypothetical protein ZMTM_24500 [Methyloradius palustris]